MISDAEIARSVETILRQTDPNAMTSLNAVVQQLEAKHGLDLSHKAGFVRDHINSLIMSSHHQQQQLQQQQQRQQIHKDHFALNTHPQFQQQPQHFPSHFALHPHQPHPPAAQLHHHISPQQQPIPHELNFRHPQPQPQPQPAMQASAAQMPPKESAPTGVKRRGGPGGLNKVCGVSPELQVIVGEPALPRTEIVKKLWAYIRKYNLQDPSNKRKIICDDALRVVFETDCTDMFKMNKLLAKHIIPINSAKDSDKAKRLKVDDESATESADPSQTLVKISEALAKFLGVDGKEMLQSEAEKRVWEYIKENKLEDPLNSMAILCDAKLHELLGCESISALGIGEMLKRHHFLEKS